VLPLLCTVDKLQYCQFQRDPITTTHNWWQQHNFCTSDFYTNTSRKNKIVSYLYYRTTLFKGEIRRTSIGCGKKAIPCRIWQIFKQPLRNFCYRMKLCSYNLCSYCHKTVNYRLIILKYDKVMWIKHGNPTVLMGLKIFTSSKETRTSKNRTAKFSLQQSITNCTFNVTLRVQSVQH